MIREAAAKHTLDPDRLLRLEHIIVAHQRLPEWGSPKPPMTPEAMLVHYADDLDAKCLAASSVAPVPSGYERGGRDSHRRRNSHRVPAGDARFSPSESTIYSKGDR
jgi:3'-5' exoribonuclease